MSLEAYLARAKERCWSKRIPEWLEQMAALKVLFIGETIIDEYRYVRPLGMPPKEYIVAVEALGAEEFQGGVAAAAAHCAEFCAVEVFSWQRVRKTRFVDDTTHRKLFEVFAPEDSPSRRGLPNLAAYDAVVVTDFGHGMLVEGNRLWAAASAKFLAVNAQSNSANHGFNPITKWRRADYIAIDLPEARLACGAQHADAPMLAARLLEQQRVECQRWVVTHGSEGCVAHDRAGLYEIPAILGPKVDTMGAGDAFLAITGPLASICDDLELVAFVGNIVGSLKVGILGHRAPVTKAMVLGKLQELLG